MKRTSLKLLTFTIRHHKCSFRNHGSDVSYKCFVSKSLFATSRATTKVTSQNMMSSMSWKIKFIYYLQPVSFETFIKNISKQRFFHSSKRKERFLRFFIESYTNWKNIVYMNKNNFKTHFGWHCQLKLSKNFSSTLMYQDDHLLERFKWSVEGSLFDNYNFVTEKRGSVIRYTIGSTKWMQSMTNDQREISFQFSHSECAWYALPTPRKLLLVVLKMKLKTFGLFPSCRLANIFSLWIARMRIRKYLEGFEFA